MSISETKREKFVRIAEARTNKIISMVQLLGNCANTASYEYSESDVNYIFGTIEKELKNAKSKFNSTEKNTKFKLNK